MEQSIFYSKFLFRRFRHCVVVACLFWPAIASPADAVSALPKTVQRPWLSALRSLPVTAEGQLDHATANGFHESNEREVIPLTLWTDRTLALIVKYRQNPLRAARSLTYMHVAMHDALALSANERPAIKRAVAHKAAAHVLAFLYPQESPGRLEALGVSAVDRMLPALTASEQAHINTSAGTVARAVIQRAWRDGSDRIWSAKSRPPFREGQWREAPPLRIVTPTEASAGNWKTWVLKDGGELQPPPPPPPGSTQEAKEMEEVLAVAKNLTDEQKSIARRWNLDQGTVTPAGVWNKLMLSLAKEQQLDDESTIAILAAMNIGMMDGFIACWHAKFTWWTQRPITAIRATLAPNFMSLLLTPPFPGYVSGHSTISGAASTVLAGFFPERRRTFFAQAEEAALSRLYGGIHTRSDNDAGLALGHAIGDKVIRQLQSPDEADYSDLRRSAGSDTK